MWQASHSAHALIVAESWPQRSKLQAVRGSCGWTLARPLGPEGHCIPTTSKKIGILSYKHKKLNSAHHLNEHGVEPWVPGDTLGRGDVWQRVSDRQHSQCKGPEEQGACGMQGASKSLHGWSRGRKELAAGDEVRGLREFWVQKLHD